MTDEDDDRSVDITHCSICKETSFVPKRLPCFHIFCTSCLQTKASISKGQSDEKLSCPVCKTGFSLPVNGFEALQTDLFVEKLVKVNDIILNLSSANLLCDAEDIETHEAPLANVYCVNCCMRLCEQCCRPHKKSELFKDHLVVNIQLLPREELLKVLAPNYCAQHTKEQLKLYCSDCKCVLCALCYIEDHQTHSWSELESQAHQFRQEIQTNSCSLSGSIRDILNKVHLLQKETSDTIKRIFETEASILAARDGLKRLIDRHADILLQQIESLKTSKLTEIDTDYEHLTRELSSLRIFLSYAEELERKGSPSDICMAMENLDKRFVELKNFESRQVKPAQLCIDFKESKLEVFLMDGGENSVGQLCVDEGGKSESKNRGCWLEDIFSKPEQLQQQQELNKSRITISLEADVNELKQSLEKANYTVYQQEQEIESHKTISSSLQEIQQTRQVQQLLQKSKQELPSQEVAQISLEIRFEKLQKELEECRLQLEENQRVHTEEIKELNIAQEKEKNEWATIADLLQRKIDEKDQCILLKEKMVQTFEEKAKYLEQLLGIAKQNDDITDKVTKGYRSTDISIGLQERNQILVLSHTIERTSTGSSSVLGLTVLGNDLFVISGCNSDIEIYDSTTFDFKRKVAVKGLTNPHDIVSCQKYESIYIMDWQRIKYGDRYVVSLEKTGKFVRKWTTGNDGGRLSVTKNSTLIVAFYNSKQFREYTRDGELLHQVIFSEDSGIVHPWHAVELNDGHFVVSFGCHTDSENKLCIVDRNGNILLSFGGKRGSKIGQLNCPAYLAADSAGNVIVADQDNGRLLLFSSKLEFIGELVSINTGDVKRRLSKFYLNEGKGKLFVADNDWIWSSSSGRVLVFDVDSDITPEQS